MSGQRSKSALYEVVYPAYFILRLFGQAPYAYPKKNEPPRLQPSWSYCTYNLIWFLVYSCNLALVIVRTANLGHKPIIAVTEMGKPIFNYVVLMIDMTMEIVKREQLVDVWNSISEFDETYQLSRTVEGKPGKYGPVLAKTKRRLWFFFSISIVGWTAVNQMSRLAYETSHLQNFCYDLSYFGTYIAGFKFSGAVFLLGQRFGYLNEVMTKMTMDKIQRYTCFNIEKIQAEYYQLISASEKLNEIYFWLLLLIISNLFWHMITTVYFFMSFVMTRPRIACAEPTWFMMFLIQLFLICVTCDYTSQEWWCKPSLHLPYRQLHFSAAGFFNVDLQLLTAIFGLMTTYLVILLQF